MELEANIWGNDPSRKKQKRKEKSSGNENIFMSIVELVNHDAHMQSHTKIPSYLLIGTLHLHPLSVCLNLPDMKRGVVKIGLSFS